MGSEEEKILSQADVDALVALVPDRPRVLSDKNNQAIMEESVQPTTIENIKAEASVVESPSSPTYTQSETEIFQQAVTELSRQVAELGSIKQRLELLEEKTEQLTRTLSQSPNNMQPLNKQISEIQIQLKEVTQNLSKKHELKDEFQCAHCKSKSTVAFYTKCTSCGNEKWFGWWPSKKRG